MPRILVIGGAGFIGSHTVLALDHSGMTPIILDDFSNSESFIVDRLNALTKKRITFYEQNYQDKVKLKDIIKKEKVDGVIHFAAFKAVGESVENPLKYYLNNVNGFVDLLHVMDECDIRNIVLSSSAAVYGLPPTDKVSETTDRNPSSPYGWSKYFDEVILEDVCRANSKLNAIALRYFNVVGADHTGKLGELPKGKPQNLLPIIIKAITTDTKLTIFGNDYPTLDGTCLRDYVHVVDLSKAHVAALKRCFNNTGGYSVYNVGTGKPTSVMELIKTFEKVNKIKVPYSIGERRPGDPPAYYAVTDKISKELHWKATKSLEDAVHDAWNWQKALDNILD